MADDNNLEPFSDDPEDAMRWENDILKLKLQAEFGANIGSMGEQVPPEIEQQFLQHVYEFEKAWESKVESTVGDWLGHPVFAFFQDIPAEEQQAEYVNVLALYAEKGISVDFLHEYPLETKYRFAAEELLHLQTRFVKMPGLVIGFTYEEFYPNHAAEMEQRASAFIEGWLELNAEKCLENCSKEMIDHLGFTDQEKIAKKMTLIFDSYTKCSDTHFEIDQVSYDLQHNTADATIGALGYVEGTISWFAHLDNGEILPFAGNFKLYLERQSDYWSIIYFVLPCWQ